MLTPKLRRAVWNLEQALAVLGPGGPFMREVLDDLPDPYTERILIGAARCKLAYASRPAYTARAARDPDYWVKFYYSQPLSYLEREPDRPDKIALHVPPPTFDDPE